jgi:hypothetical protein
VSIGCVLVTASVRVCDLNRLAAVVPARFVDVPADAARRWSFLSVLGVLIAA